MNGEIILYTTEDGGKQVRLREIDGTVWRTQAQMAELFKATKQNVSLHKHIGAMKKGARNA